MDLYKIGINEAENKLQLEGYEFSLEQLVQKIMEYKDRSNVNLFSKMNSDYIISIMGKDYLQDLEKHFMDSSHKQMGILQFVRTFLSIIPHNEEETIFLTLGLIEFFKGISESLNMAQEVKFSDITTAICDRVSTQFEDEYKIQTRDYPPERRFTDQVEGNHGKSKKIDFKAPIVHENNLHNSLRRLHKGKFKTDSTFHNKQSITHGVFAKEIKKLITLDSLDDKLSIYDLNCNLVKRINLKNKEDDSKLDIIIFGIAWSEKQQRIGAVLKNFTLSFWDGIDDFEFEKNFSVHGYTQDYQNNIWYLEKHEMWITTDSKNGIYSWDIANENTTFSLITPSIQGAIFQVIELPQINYCAVGSLDKKVSIWNFYTQILLFQIDVGQVGVHSIAFSNAFQVLLTAGYENSIQLYTIDNEYLDSTLIGKLRGHNSMISSIQVIESTPIVVSADDLGIVRLWDIRNQSCIQSYECSSSQAISNSFAKKMNIQLIIDMYSEGMVAFIGSRINLVNFDEKDEILKQFNQVENLFPFKVENNTARDELIVCTRKNIQFYDMNTGLCKFTMNGLMESSQDEITVFKQIQQGQKFLLGNQKGQVSLHSYQQNGERIKYLSSHTNEVTQLKIDYLNKLLISGGWDSIIKIQKLSDETIEKLSEKTNELKRKIENVHYEKQNLNLTKKQGVSLLEASVYHNVIFSSTQNLEKIFVYDYEYGRLLNYIEFKKKTEPTALCVIQGYPILIVATSENLIYVIHFLKKENKVRFDLLGVINVDIAEKIFHQANQKSNNDFDLFITKQKEEEEDKPQQQFQQNASQAQIITDVSQNQLQKGQHLSIPSVYHSLAQTEGYNQLSPQERTSVQLEHLHMNEHYSSGDATTRTENINTKRNYNLTPQPKAPEKESQVYITKILPEFNFNQKNELQQSRIYCTNSKGFITVFDLSKIFSYYDEMQFHVHSNTRMNYNPHRNSTEDFKASVTRISEIKQKYQEKSELTDQLQKQVRSPLSEDHISQFINNLAINSVQAHKELITSITFLNGDSQRIMTSSQDYYVRIWDKDNFQQLCSLNINHPLPVQWDYRCNHDKKSQKQVLFALRILDLINKKYNTDVSRKEESSTKIVSFLKKLVGIRKAPPSHSQIKSPKKRLKQKQEEGITNEEEERDQQMQKSQNKLTMQEYYSPRDIKYEEIKHFYKNELLGPSLKRLEINKRVAIAQQIWKKPKLTKEEQNREQIKKMLDLHVKSDERETILNFLDPDFRNQILKKGYNFEDDYTRYTLNLQNKIELYEKNAQMKANAKLKTQSSGISVQIQSSMKLLVPQSGKRQQTQTSQNIQMNQTSRPSIVTDQSAEQKSIPASSSAQNNDAKKRLSILFKNQQQPTQNTKQKGLKSKQTLTLQLDTIKDISYQNNSQTKLSQSQIPLSPQVKEPFNFENLLHRIPNSPKIVHKTISIFPDSQDTKIRVDAFPQTAAKLQQLYNQRSGEVDSITQTNITVSPQNNKSQFGINSEYKNKKTTQDLYKYAQEKQIIGNSNLSSQGISMQTNGSSASQIVSASSNKLHSILNGINSKLMKFKKIGNLTNNNTTFISNDRMAGIQNTRTLIDYEIIKQTEQDPFSQQSSQRTIQKDHSKKLIFGGNSSAYLNDFNGFNNTISHRFERTANKNIGNNTTFYPNQENSNEQSQYFSVSNMNKNRQSLPSIIINKK